MGGFWIHPPGGGGGGGGMNYNDIGDPAAYHFSVGDFNCDGSWHDLDLSAHVGAQAILSHLLVRLMENSTTTINAFFRENGNSNFKNYLGATTAGLSGKVAYEDGQVMTDSAGKVEYMVTSTPDELDLCVRGYWA